MAELKEGVPVNLIFYSLRHLGGPSDSMVKMEKELAARMASSKYMKDVLEEEGEGVEIIILFDCIEDYLANRLHVRGRPWVCAVSTVFADLYSTYRTGLSADEMNIHLILSNCQTFVDNSKGLAKFLNPIWHLEITDPFPVPDHNPICMFSCNVPNIEDRDWSLVKYISERTEKNRLPPVIIGRNLGSGQEIPSVRGNPLGLEERSTFVPGHFEVIAPRITDYRAGVIPYEIMVHLQFGRRVLACKHQILEPVLPYLHIFESLKELDLLLRDSAQLLKSRDERPYLPAVLTYGARIFPARPSVRPSIPEVLKIMEEEYQKWVSVGKSLVVDGAGGQAKEERFMLDSSIKGEPAEVKSGSPA